MILQGKVMMMIDCYGLNRIGKMQNSKYWQGEMVGHEIITNL